MISEIKRPQSSRDDDVQILKCLPKEIRIINNKDSKLKKFILLKNRDKIGKHLANAFHFDAFLRSLDKYY